MTNHWTESEIEATVADYFDMLKAELLGQRYQKAAHRRALIERLNNRSEGSVERKHQNISAVLIEMGVPYIDGYKPLFNYQRALVPRISDYLKRNVALQSLFQADSELLPATPTVTDFLALLEDPPSDAGNRHSGAVREVPMPYNPGGVNYLEREAHNQQLGDAGEAFILNYERARLIFAGKETLADRIEHVAVTEGPVAGFDIRSFEVDGTDRFIEAKTTKYGKSTPFYVTPNELRFSEQHSARYHLYRLFRFRDDPKLFSLQGHLRDNCELKSSQYTAVPK